MSTPVSLSRFEGHTPFQAAINAGLSEELAHRYTEVIAERADYIAWDDEGRTTPWVLYKVDIPDGAPHLIDTAYGAACYIISDGIVVYDDEPDCVVVVSPGHPGRFVPIEEGM